MRVLRNENLLSKKEAPLGRLAFLYRLLIYVSNNPTFDAAQIVLVGSSTRSVSPSQGLLLSITTKMDEDHPHQLVFCGVNRIALRFQSHRKIPSIWPCGLRIVRP